MTIAALAQQTVLDDASRIARRLPLGAALGALHPGGCFPLVQDPRGSARTCIVGMMVLRPATTAWTPASLDHGLAGEMQEAHDWCFDVKGIGGSWPISGGNVLDAYRLALQYGTVDAVLAGATTVAREGLVAGARGGHLWQPYTPLSWAVLRPHRDVLEPAIAALRVQWQELGVLSARRHPAQIAVTASGRLAAGQPDLLNARMFHDRHPDGSPIEAYLLTSEGGASRLRERADAKGQRIDERLIVVSGSDHPEEIDVARVPEVLRSKLDVRLAEHDGGAVSLEAFARAGAIAQFNLTLMRARSVRDVVASSTRIEEGLREDLLATWQQRVRLFPLESGRLPRAWQPVYALAEQGRDAEAVVVTYDARAA